MGPQGLDYAVRALRRGGLVLSHAAQLWGISVGLSPL